MRILLVEDNELLGEGIKQSLATEGHTVDILTDGISALHALEVEEFDTVILDLGLPGMDGLDVLKRLRGTGNNIKVLILTARDSIDDRVQGLDSGADDYLAKPFDLDELCARLRALHRRESNRANPLLIHGKLKLNPASHTVEFENTLVNIPRREFALLHKLLQNVGRVLSRDQLTQSLYGWDDDVDSNALEVHIHNLRKKFGTSLIRTIRGVGYMVEKCDAEKNSNDSTACKAGG